MKNYGEVIHEGKTLRLTENAFECGGKELEDMRYAAPAIDADGNEYRIFWRATASYIERLKEFPGEYQDEGDACDWDHPEEVKEY